MATREQIDLPRWEHPNGEEGSKGRKERMLSRRKVPVFAVVELVSWKMPYLSGRFVLKWEDVLSVLHETNACEDHVECGLRRFFHRVRVIVVAYGVAY